MWLESNMKVGSNSFMLKRIYRLLPPGSRKKCVWQVALTFLSSLLNFAGLASLYPLLKVILEERSNQSHVWMVTAAVLAFILMKNLLVLLISKIQARFLLSQYKYFSTGLFRTYYQRGLLFIKENGPVRLMNDVNSLCHMFSMSVLQGFFKIVGETLLALLIFSALFYLSAKVTLLLVMVAIPLLVIYALVVRRQLRLLGEEEILARRDQCRTVVDTFRGYVELETYSAFNKQNRLFESSMDMVSRCRQRSVTIVSLPTLLSELAIVIGLVLLLMSQGGEQLLVSGSFALAAFRLMPAFRTIAERWTAIQQSSYCVEVLEREMGGERNTVEAKPISFHEALKAEHLTFSFSDGTKVFENFDLTIRKGEHIGICGQSGAGKSTLFNLLLGFYRPLSGHVTVDGVELDETTQRSWLDLVGYVPQNVFITQGSIRENVALGYDEVDEARLSEALRRACLSEWVESLPDGNDTLLGESGARLSGGQKQRIGIARALYKGAEVIFLDEATSSVDNETEQEINETFRCLSESCKEMTIVVIAHRESSLSYCSRIININVCTI